MVTIVDKAKCSGCAACYSICPKNAIDMKGDALGFEYPNIDINKCIDCGLCDRVCMYNNKIELSETHIAYGVRHKNIKEVEKSRSGAVFIALSDYILKQGGSVYGASLEADLCVKHIKTTSYDERDKLRGSKYVQSSINDSFILVKKDLENGKKVLFSGTPCQVYGLKKYINNKLHSNLFLIDIICHGVPSPSFYRDYITYISTQNNGKVISINFRNKYLYGWSPHYETYYIKKGKKKKRVLNSFFTHFYYRGYLYRDACEKCPFSTKNRTGDITIGDFWGWEKTTNTTNKDNKGLSLSLINTDQGLRLFNSCKDQLHYFPTKWDEYIQPNLIHPSKPNDKSGQFKQDYIDYGIEFVCKKYGLKGISKLRYQARRIKTRILHLLNNR